MSVFQRLAQIARPYNGTLLAGLILIMTGSLLDTGIITFLFAGMAFIVIGKAGMGMQSSQLSLKLFKYDLSAPLQHLAANGDKLHLLMMFAGATAIAVFLKCSCDARQGYLMNRFSNLMALDIRQRLFRHLLRLSPAYFEQEATGGQLSRVTSDVVALQACMGAQLIEVVRAPYTVIIALVFMIGYSWQLTLVGLCLAPLIAVITGLGARQIRRLSIRIQERLGDFNAILVERLSNVRVIQSFVREDYETEQVARSNKRYFRETMRSVLITETLSPGTEFILNLGMILGIVIGGIVVISGFISIGGHQIHLGKIGPQTFLTFLFLAQKAGSQFKALSRITQVRQQATGAAIRIFELMDVKPEITDALGAAPLPPVEGRVTFDHVEFSYGTGECVLHDIAFEAAPGEVIALVGPSGAGKTTLVNLLARFYDPTAGSILVDGHDLRAVTLVSLREQVGSVPQETALFGGTIYENILYGKLDAAEDEVIAAARAANALEFIERLPEGFQTIVGERGTRISGGQRQRVAIARALLKNPRILILDEATSALDTESEHLVQQALERLMENRTTFVIAHRLSTVQHATRILVMEHGRIIEIGTHQELLERGGLYQRLYAMQFRETVPLEVAPIE